MALVTSACAGDSSDDSEPAGTTGGAGSAGATGTAATSGAAGTSNAAGAAGLAGLGSAGASGTESAGAGAASGTSGGDAGVGGADAGAEGGADAGDAGADAGISSISLDDFACPGGAIAPGTNTIAVGTLMRSFYVEFPSNMAGPVGIIFSWHGFNDPASDGDAAGWRSADEVDANADPSHPAVVVTPFDVDFEVPVGLDWQLDQGTAAGNVDLAFFEAMLGCLNAQYDIDPGRIYSYGFSAGSVMSSLIHSAYPEIVSAIACVSGMWFNDPAQVQMINLIPIDPRWPALNSDDGGAVLLTHGGPNDVTVLGIANLENMAQAAFPFLKAANRVVVDCGHGSGHTLHPDLTTGHVMKFFADHRGGRRSPYASGSFAGYPPSCTLRLP
jgi:poly(3-hydroxybutyrate) depolymerase